jgi:hypothetical protein
VVFGCIGAATGIGAIIYADITRRGGRKTTDIAIESNDLATKAKP